MRWSQKDQAFIVTLYDRDGRPVYEKVTDYYTNGNQGDDLGGGRRGPNLMSVYERAYGQYLGDHNLPDGRPNDAMQTISGQDAQTVHTTGLPASPLPAWNHYLYNDHKYTEQEWSQIEQAVNNGQPVVAVTNDGDFGDGDTVDATANTHTRAADKQHPDAAIDNKDKSDDYRIVGGDYDRNDDTDPTAHAYTVIAIDDEYVTLRNPRAHNDTADGSASGDDGIIRITREDYEKYFGRTDIGDNIP